jgi:predicted DNA-binding transcriptional regulator AlpA
MDTNELSNTDANVSPLDGHISRQRLAQLTGRSERFWYRLDLERRGPPVTRLGKSVLYRVQAVRDWLEAQEQRPAKSRYRSKR